MLADLFLKLIHIPYSLSSYHVFFKKLLHLLPIFVCDFHLILNVSTEKYFFINIPYLGLLSVDVAKLIIDEGLTIDILAEDIAMLF